MCVSCDFELIMSFLLYPDSVKGDLGLNVYTDEDTSALVTVFFASSEALGFSSFLRKN